MTSKIFYKSSLNGNVVANPSKSALHRLIIISFLSNSDVVINNVYEICNDIKETIKALESLNANIKYVDNKIYIRKTPLKRVKDIYIEESGSTLRFIIPICMLVNELFIIDGSTYLKKRPIKSFIPIFEKDDVYYELEENKLPLLIKGLLKGGKYNISTDISSQFASGLIMTLPLIKKSSKLILSDITSSIDYIDLTIDIINKFINKKIVRKNNIITIKGKSSYSIKNISVEGCFSSQAFFIVANAIGANINIENLDYINSKQADRKIVDHLKTLGYILDDNYKLISSFDVNNLVISLNNEPDLLPILSIAAIKKNIDVKFINLERLAYKESNRILSVYNMLVAFGATVKYSNNMLHIKSVKLNNTVKIKTENDHRIAMAAIIGSLLVKKVYIDNIECINKSYPTFLKTYELLGGKYE